MPIYQVTVVERTVKAVNYQYRGGPTQIDFAGTVLMPQAKGQAIVESKKGRTAIDVKFSRVEAPGRFGPEYLTYVLWAITPEGHAKNLGEVLANSGDNAHLTVTTDLQAFGMIVTAEPYSAVRQPSDVVVMENVVRPDTIGRIEPIQAKYELLPRGSYTYTRPEGAPAEGPKVSMDRYESLVEIYQAQNAIQIARSQGADKYAADTLSKAENLLSQAREMEQHRAGRSSVVTLARQAAQTAEDARMIARQGARDAELAQTREALAQEKLRREAAEHTAREAQIQASEQRADLAQERAQREQAEAAAAAPNTPVPEPPPPPVRPVERADRQIDARKTENRAQLLQRMNTYFTTKDTPRGLMITLQDRDFRGPAIDPAISARLANLASMLAGQPGLRIEVDGHGEQYATERAGQVRDTMLQAGLSSSVVTAQSFGTSRPLVSNTTAANREENRRVEIVVSGDPIGSLATWDRTYPIH
ncbi:MAG TPA: OmpA family protein [Candidatus Acidoferrales bacterium]|nr:OmpA family protein [Candidatus Acidoferrales bacterium]